MPDRCWCVVPENRRARRTATLRNAHRVKTHAPCDTTHRPRPTMSADASERENETWWNWPAFLEKWLRHASWRSALCAGITLALACIDRSAVMRERSHTGKEKLLGGRYARCSLFGCQTRARCRIARGRHDARGPAGSGPAAWCRSKSLTPHVGTVAAMASPQMNREPR